jgi:centriolar protein POC1
MSFVNKSDIFTVERTFRGHRNAITSLSFDPQMTKLAGGAMDNNVIVWSFKENNRAYRYKGHKVFYQNLDIIYF